MLKILAVLVSCIGAVTDLKTHKIKNKLTLPAIWMGLIFHVISGGFTGLWDSVLGILIGFCCIFLWLLGTLKAGDVKLYMAVGALGGSYFVWHSILYSVLIGGAAGAFIMVFRKNGRNSLKKLGIYLWNLLLSREFHKYESDDKSYFPFGICIAAGVICSCFMN